jgi:hypothetical protein
MKVSKTPVRRISPREIRELRDFLLNNPNIHRFRSELVKFVVDSALKELKNNSVK